MYEMYEMYEKCMKIIGLGRILECYFFFFFSESFHEA